jgi:3-deoxy-D-manno-octulosonate 8-phosphate phosphatase (KDO 8-P phosphatase)
LKLLVLDVDGVLTDGGILYTDDGREMKRFHAADGAAIKRLQAAGVAVAILTGRQSPMVARRAEELGIDLLRQGSDEKLPRFGKLLEEAQVQPDEAAYMGDDLVDLPCLVAAGFAAAPANARPDVRCRVDYVTTAAGGAGAVAELAEHILDQRGQWQAMVEDFEQMGRAWLERIAQQQS